jgi:putative addiction module CopG family antidote
MQISLQSRDRKFIRRQIEAGRYDSEKEVLLAGLRTLEALEAVDEERKARRARRPVTFVVDPKELPHNTPVLLKIVDDWLAKRRVPRRKRKSR